MLSVMTGSPLTLACDDEASQILLEDLPAGPAGEAGLIPVDGVELLFDNADGRLARVLVDAAESADKNVAGEPALFFIAGLLGTQAATAVRKAHRWGGAPIPLRADEDKLADLSRLARLDAARSTSPFADSPGWAVEAARLAGRAGLTARAAAEARRATVELEATVAGAGPPADAMPAALVSAVADVVQETDPRLADRLREHARLSRAGRTATAQSNRAWLAVLPHDRGDGGSTGGPERWLDPQTIPAGVFRYHAWPETDLTVRGAESGLRVDAAVVPTADRVALATCRVRLVDPARRAVIWAAPFQMAGCSMVSAEIPHPVPTDRSWPTGGAWIEVVGEAGRPVHSAQLRHMRRAMRWADAALLAARTPPGPAETEWDRLAGRAWERCARDWAAARDFDRAFLAADRARALGSGISVAEPPSAWAKDLARRPALWEAPFLAETVS
jgi:hypothetical protein